jgi:hypothetical protein
VYVRLCTSNTGLNSGQDLIETLLSKMMVVFNFKDKHTLHVFILTQHKFMYSV